LLDAFRSMVRHKDSWWLRRLPKSFAFVSSQWCKMIYGGCTCAPRFIALVSPSWHIRIHAGCTCAPRSISFVWSSPKHCACCIDKQYGLARVWPWPALTITKWTDVSIEWRFCNTPTPPSEE
jgi:hypothetical protein